MHDSHPRGIAPEARNEAIAEEHRHLSEQIETICLIVESKPGDTACLLESIQELTKMTRVHFRHEEMMMHRSRFPGTLMHKRDHDYLVRGLVEFAASLVDETVVVTPEFCNGLRSWMDFHTRKYDDSYREFRLLGAGWHSVPTNETVA